MLSRTRASRDSSFFYSYTNKRRPYCSAVLLSHAFPPTAKTNTAQPRPCAHHERQTNTHSLLLFAPISPPTTNLTHAHLAHSPSQPKNIAMSSSTSSRRSSSTSTTNARSFTTTLYPFLISLTSLITSLSPLPPSPSSRSPLLTLHVPDTTLNLKTGATTVNQW